MIDRRANDRQTERGVYRLIKAKCLQRNVALIVVHAHEDIGGPAFTPYVKFERVDTQAKMPVGYSRSLSTLNNWRTIGFEFKSIPNVVVKVDYMKNTNDAKSGLDQFNVALGYGF